MRRFGTYLAFVVALVVWVAWGLADVDSPSDLSSVDSQTRETSLGDLIADAVRDDAHTPIALIPAGCLREITVPKGKINADAVIPCLQYPEDHVAVIEITGDRLWQALERSVGIFPQKNMGFLQVSGIRVVFDPDAPKGSRIVSLTVGDQPVSGDRTYRIAMTEALAQGAHGYFTVWGRNPKHETRDSTMADAVATFLSANRPVDYREQTRIMTKSD